MVVGLVYYFKISVEESGSYYSGSSHSFINHEGFSCEFSTLSGEIGPAFYNFDP